MINFVRCILAFLITTQLLFYSVLSYRTATLMADFCEAHENEIEKIEKNCYDRLHVQVCKKLPIQLISFELFIFSKIWNIFKACLIEIRNQRAPFKSIDGKYRQFIICDNELSGVVRSIIFSNITLIELV